jgi:hypothetical protein
VATTTRRIEELQIDKARLEQQNLELKVEIADLESVSRLAERARELGFTIVTLDNAEFVVASVPDVDLSRVARSVGDEGLGGVETQSKSWLDSVAAQFTAWVQSESP